jgi:hypothetical protein
MSFALGAAETFSKDPGSFDLNKVVRVDNRGIKLSFLEHFGCCCRLIQRL